MENFENLHDAKGFKPGATQIWYAKLPKPFGLMFGYEVAKIGNLLPDPKDLSKTHILLGSIETKINGLDVFDPKEDANLAESRGRALRDDALRDLESVYRAMQGEEWSPMGEARSLISSRGLQHTSMSVGDLIVCGGVVHMVDSCGFKELGHV